MPTLSKIIKIGPRGFWKQANGTWFTQIIKYTQNEDGSYSRFCLNHKGNWREYDKSHRFTNDETFVLSDDCIYECEDKFGELSNAY